MLITFVNDIKVPSDLTVLVPFGVLSAAYWDLSSKLSEAAYYDLAAVSFEWSLVTDQWRVLLKKNILNIYILKIYLYNGEFFSRICLK